MAERRPMTGHGLRPNKRLGQHFLRESGFIHEILERADFDESDHILEIGPGLGALTLPMSKTVRHVFAVEKDPRLAEALGKKLRRGDIHNVTIIHEDILKLDFDDLPGPIEKKLKIIGNLPYNISSPLLEKLIGNRTLFSRAVLMFQRELALRLIASPGSKAYGALTVLIQYHTSVCPLLDVPGRAFYPRPKVDSMVLGFDFEAPHPRKAEDEVRFQRVVRGAFAHRRKTLLNALSGVFSSSTREDIHGALGLCGIDSGRRAETLTIDDFLRLTRATEFLS